MLCRCPAQKRAKWLSLAEWWYNTCIHSVIKMTPYEAVYGVPPTSTIILYGRYHPDPSSGRIALESGPNFKIYQGGTYRLDKVQLNAVGLNVLCESWFCQVVY